MPPARDHATHGPRLVSPGTAARFAALLLGVAAFPAHAHEYWLAPSKYVAASGETIGIGALAGTGFRGGRKPFHPTRCVRLVVRAAKPLDLAPLGVEGEYTWARFAPADAGGALLAFESDFASITLPGFEFDHYLESEGLDGPREARRKAAAPDPVRERYRRCAKAWLAGSAANRATQPIGMPLEIVPLSAPGGAASLRVRLLWQGRPLSGALVRAWRAPLGADGALTDPEMRDSVGVAWQGRTDARGEATAHVEAAGEWLIAAVHMVPGTAPGVADWESTWASLTFVRRRAARP